jgi:3-hydroxyisobutyrate dehydrogenase
MTTVGLVGLGKMGSAMALRLLVVGHRVQVWSRSPGKAQVVEGAGAVVCASPKLAADGADALLSMVSDDVASRAVWLGDDGLLAGAKSGALAVECSTLSRAWVLELAQRARAQGARYIDAPVTGLPDAARAGELTLLVGAEPADLRAADALFAALATRVLCFGPVGAGTAYKLVINMLGAVQIASLAEALVLAERAGLELATVVDALATSQAASPQVVRNARRMLADDHAQNVVFTPALRLKDVEYALELARAAGSTTPFAALAAELFRRLLAAHPAPINESAVIEIARTRMPG